MRISNFKNTTETVYDDLGRWTNTPNPKILAEKNEKARRIMPLHPLNNPLWCDSGLYRPEKLGVRL